MGIRYFFLVLLSIFGVFAGGFSQSKILELPSINFKPEPVLAVEVEELECPNVAEGSKGSAAPTVTFKALKEKKPVSCTGIFGGLCTIIQSIIDVGLAFIFGADATHTLQLGDSTMPYSLTIARNLSLSSDGENTSGFIAKMLPPRYTQEIEEEERDVKEVLRESEGRFVDGFTVLNKDEEKELYTDIHEDIGDYDLLKTGAGTNRKLKTYFRDVAPVFDRFGFLQQSLVPGAGEVELEVVDCPLSEPLEAGPLLILDAERETDWDGTAEFEGGDSIEGVDPNPSDPDCPPANAEKNPALADGVCPLSGEEDFFAYGDADVTSEVSLISELWKRVAGKSSTPGESGVLNVLLPPGWRFRSEDALESVSPTTYNSRTAGAVSSSSTIPIAGIGGLEGALSCITQQLTQPPANAAEGFCEEWLVSEVAGEFTGWPTEHGCITQGANTSSTHAGAEAIDIASNFSIPDWSSAGQIFGKPILATHAGRVEAGCADAGGCGNAYSGKWVSVRADDGSFASQYWHLSDVYVGIGDTVSPGTVVGAMGWTGNVYPHGPGGTHLHYHLIGTTISGNTPEEVPPGCLGRAQCNICW